MNTIRVVGGLFKEIQDPHKKMEVEDNITASTFLQQSDRSWTGSGTVSLQTQNGSKRNMVQLQSSQRNSNGKAEESPDHWSPILTPLMKPDIPFYRGRNRAEGRLSGGCRLPVEMFDLLPIPE